MTFSEQTLLDELPVEKQCKSKQNSKIVTTLYNVQVKKVSLGCALLCSVRIAEIE